MHKIICVGLGNGATAPQPQLSEQAREVDIAEAGFVKRRDPGIVKFTQRVQEVRASALK
jgi:hypothetical protein